MKLHYSRTIEQFSTALGVQKSMVEDTFNKPDMTDIMGGYYISIKVYGDHFILITFRTKGNDVFFENAYKIYPSMLDIDLGKASTIDVLKDFMSKYGMEVDVPGLGKQKVYVDEKQRIFFQGILDVEKYAAAISNLSQPA